MSNGSDQLANELYDSLMDGVSVDIPEIDWDDPQYQIPGGEDSPLYDEITPISIEDVTTRQINGDGAFDAFMMAMKQHLREEYDSGRITGGEYTKAYINTIQTAMGNATQFILGRDQALWAAVTAQVQAITAVIQMQTAKIEYASLFLRVLTEKANFALTKLRLSNEDAQYGIADYNLKNILPEQYMSQQLQNTQLEFNIDNILPKQVEQFDGQIALVKEQKEVQLAQTQDQRTDGATVVGVLGKQKDLYQQQITSYQRDSELKAAKVFSDAWTVQKTVDEGLLPPEGFENASLDEILTTLKTNNNLGS